MPLPALLAVTALAGAAVLSGRTQVGSRARMTAAQAAAHKARLVWLLRAGRWRDALELNKAEGKRRLHLRGADLAYANLTGANLFRADLTDANLFGANLSGSDLSLANLTNADLTDADLTDADLTDADISAANLSGADLTGADLAGASLPEGFLAPNTRLDAVPWTGTPSGWRVVASPRGVRLFPLPKA